MANVFQKITDRFLGDKGLGPEKPIEQASDQSPDEVALVAYIRDKVDECRQSGSRVANESIWLTNVAYLLGYSGVTYDSALKQYKNTDPGLRAKGRKRVKVNKILPTVQNRLARLTKSPPKYDVRPESNSSEDKDACRLSLHVLDDVFDKQKFLEKRQELKMAVQQYGYAFVQVSWDPMLGKPMVDPISGEFSEYEGDIRLDILTPFEVFRDPLAKRMDDLTWWVKAKVRKLSYFRERYEKGAAVKEEDAWLLSSQYEQRINALTANGGTGSSTHAQMKNSAIEIVYYEKRSKEHPNGRMIVTANGILLENKDLPIGEFDLTKFDDILISGRFESEAIITHLRPIQDRHDMLMAKRAEWVRKMLAGKYVVPRGANLSQTALNNESGEVLEYSYVPNHPTGGQPIPMSIPAIPQYAYEEEAQIDKQFDFVSGINEVSRGELPSASIPAAGMQFLQEQDETRIGVMTSRDEIGYAQVGRHILLYGQQYYKMPRLLKIAGDGLAYTVKEFVGADLRGNQDVIVLPGSTIPGSKVLRRQEILNAYQMGILGNPGDTKLQQKILKMLEFGDTAEMWKSQAMDDGQVKRIISAVEAGEIPKDEMDEKDNHIYLLSELNDYRKSDKFRELDPEKRMILEYVMEWHLQAQVRMLNPGLPQQQMLAQEMAKQAQQLPTPQVDPMGNPMAPPPVQNPMMSTPPGPQTSGMSVGA